MTPCLQLQTQQVKFKDAKRACAALSAGAPSLTSHWYPGRALGAWGAGARLAEPRTPRDNAVVKTLINLNAQVKLTYTDQKNIE